ADVLVTCQFRARSSQPAGTVTAVLNGTRLGTLQIAPGWQTLQFRAGRPSWWIGFNALDLLLDLSSDHSMPGPEADRAASMSAPLGVGRVLVVRPGLQPAP